jgi:hypothetical protein
MQKLRIFAASASDVATERAKVAEVAARLKPLADARGLVLDVVDWRAVVPGMGPIEELILSQLNPKEWDIFVGLLWHRFGTPPGTGYRSGTEEEFQAAYQLWKEYRKPRVMFYRCTREVPPDVRDSEQFERVEDFFAQFEPSGKNPGLYHSFDTIEEFEDLLFDNLQRLLLDYGEQSAGARAEPQAQAGKDKTIPGDSLTSRPHEIFAYLSLLSFVACPLLALGGLFVEQRFLPWLFIAAVVVPLLGYAYLRVRYRRVKVVLEMEGEAPRPQWLWTTLSQNITHEKSELSGGEQVMVLVPHGARRAADLMKQVYNGARQEPAPEGQGHREDGHDLLLFHCLRRPGPDGRADESAGATLEGDDERTFKQMEGAMDKCVAVVMLDDSTWGKYGETKKAVARWGVKHTAWPIITIRVGSRGRSLRYTDFKFADVVKEDASRQTVIREYQPLPSLLLTQAGNRAARWRQQARTHRRLLEGLAALTASLLFIFIAAGFYGRYRFGELRAQLAEEQSRQPREKRATTADPEKEHPKAADALKRYRDAKSPREQYDQFGKLLKDNAELLRDMLAHSAAYNSKSMEVIMFSVEGDQGKGHDRVVMREVAATRPPLTGPFEAVRGDKHIDGIVSCAVANRAFVLWSGESAVGEVPKTHDIVAWDLGGHKISGEFLPQTGEVKIGEQTCSYKPIPWDYGRRQLLCAPVGMRDRQVGQVIGAVCVSAEGDADFLDDLWMHHRILNFGNSLSFVPWEAALSYERWEGAIPHPTPTLPTNPDKAR